MKFTIIGGGISGLSTALAFEKLGIEYELYEAAPVLNEVGAGIWMASNAMQIFGWLGIADQIQNEGMCLDHVELADQNFRTISTTNQQLIIDALGYSIVSIHRGRLQKILYDNLPSDKVHLGKQTINIIQDESQVTTEFADGSFATSDGLIAADGINSVIRKQLLPNSQIQYSGQTCWRGVAKVELSAELSKSCVETWGNQIRFGISAISHQEVYWFAVAKSASSEKDDQETLKEKLKGMFKNFSEPVASIIEATPQNKIIRSDISDLKPLDQWSVGKVLFIGDAGHATTPNMGQGGAQAVEDAYYLANLLNKHQEITLAYQTFEKIRKPKVNDIVSGSRNIGKLAHIKYGRRFRNFLMRQMPSSLTNRQMIKLYSLREF